MRRLLSVFLATGILVGVLVLAAGILLSDGSGTVSAGDVAGGGADSMDIDMDPSTLPANTGSAVGTLETCAAIFENNVLDGDEDATDVLDVDVVIQNIPAPGSIGSSFTLNFPTPNLPIPTVTGPKGPLL